MESYLEKYNLMGIQISNITYSGLNDYIYKKIKEKRKAAILNVNINAMNIALYDKKFYEILSSTDLVFADGMGIVYAARIAGCNLPYRITYADWMWNFAKFCSKRRISWYFLGAKRGIAELASKNLIRQNSQLQILGYHHGYFLKQGIENEKVIDDINKKKPDVLFVCLGMPIQEKWIHKYMKKIDASIFLSGGACLDFVSGVNKRCPRWMGSIGLEWLFRFIQEPKRLAGRYIYGNPMFMIRFIKFYLKKK